MVPAVRIGCMGKKRDCSPVNLCKNKSWGADKLEAMVWAELQSYLGDRDLIINEIEKQRQEAKRAVKNEE